MIINFCKNDNTFQKENKSQEEKNIEGLGKKEDKLATMEKEIPKENNKKIQNPMT